MYFSLIPRSSSDDNSNDKCSKSSGSSCQKPMTTTGLAVGLAVGVPIGAILISLFIVWYYSYKKNKKEEEDFLDFDNEDTILPETYMDIKPSTNDAYRNSGVRDRNFDSDSNTRTDKARGSKFSDSNRLADVYYDSPFIVPPYISSSMSDLDNYSRNLMPDNASLYNLPISNSAESITPSFDQRSMINTRDYARSVTDRNDLREKTDIDLLGRDTRMNSNNSKSSFPPPVVARPFPARTRNGSNTYFSQYSTRSSNSTFPIDEEVPPRNSNRVELLIDNNAVIGDYEADAGHGVYVGDDNSAGSISISSLTTTDNDSIEVQNIEKGSRAFSPERFQHNKGKEIRTPSIAESSYLNETNELERTNSYENNDEEIKFSAVVLQNMESHSSLSFSQGRGSDDVSINEREINKNSVLQVVNYISEDDSSKEKGNENENENISTDSESEVGYYGLDEGGQATADRMISIYRGYMNNGTMIRKDTGTENSNRESVAEEIL